MKKNLLLIFCSVVFMSASGAFMWSVLGENDMVLIVPAILMFLFACVFLFLLFKEIFIRHNEYRFENSVLQVSRKGTLITSIEKEKLTTVVMIYDMFTKEEEAALFSYQKNRFYVRITPENKADLKTFLKGLPCKTKDNVWYYLISFLCH